jgi:hypothetical protein
MRFLVVSPDGSIDHQATPAFALQRDDSDDDGFKTLYQLHVLRPGHDPKMILRIQF